MALRNPNPRGLLQIVAFRPGIAPVEVARALGIAPSTLHHHVVRLVAWRILRTQRHQKSLRMWIEPDATDPLLLAMGVARTQIPSVPGKASPSQT